MGTATQPVTVQKMYPQEVALAKDVSEARGSLEHARDESPAVLGRWLHIACVALDRLEIRALWPPQMVEVLILHGSGDKLFDARGTHGLHSLWCELAQKSGVYPRLK